MQKWTWAIGLVACSCWVAVAALAGEAKEAAPPPGATAAKPGAPLPGQPAAENPPDAADAKIHEILKTKQVSVEFDNAPLSDALSFFKATLGVNVVVAGNLDTKQRVTLQVNNMNAGAALQWMLRVAGAQMAVKNGAIHVAAGAREEGPVKVKPEGAADDEGTRKIAEAMKRKVSFDFVETPLGDALNFLQALVNANIIVAPEVKRNQPLTLRVNDMPIGQALQWMVKLVGAKMEIRDGAIYISGEHGEVKPPARGGNVRDPRFNRMLGKAQVSLGAAASIEFYLYEDDIAPELREAVLSALQKALAAELRKVQGAEGAGKK